MRWGASKGASTAEERAAAEKAARRPVACNAPPLASDKHLKIEDQSKAAAACWPLAVSDTQDRREAHRGLYQSHNHQHGPVGTRAIRPSRWGRAGRAGQGAHRKWAPPPACLKALPRERAPPASCRALQQHGRQPLPPAGPAWPARRRRLARLPSSPWPVAQSWLDATLSACVAEASCT